MICTCIIAALLTVTIATPPRFVQATADPVQAINAAAHDRFDAGDAAAQLGDTVAAVAAFQDSARLWLRAVDELAGDATRQGERSGYLSKAINGLRLAFERDTKRCDLLIDALKRINAYIKEGAKPGQEAEDAVAEQRGRILALREDHCKPPEADLDGNRLLVVPSSPSEAHPPPEERREPSSTKEDIVVEPAPSIPLKPVASRPRTLVVATAATASLTVVLGTISLGTGLSRVQQPFHGAAYQSILDAAIASEMDGDPTNDVSSDMNTNMCGELAVARNDDVATSCHRFAALGTTSIVTGVLAAVAGVAAIATGILLSRRQPQRSSALNIEPFASGLRLRF